MKNIFFALKNLRRYPYRTISSIICCFIFTFLILVTCLYSYFTNMSLNYEMNIRGSGNFISIKNADVDDENYISELSYIKETIYMYQSFISGEIDLEDVGSFDINSFLIYTENGKIPMTFIEELDAVYSEGLIVGRQIQNENEIILNAGYFIGLQFKDLTSLIGKKVTMRYDFWGEDVVVAKEATLVGLVSDKIKDISFFNDYPSELTFLMCDDEILQNAQLLSFFEYGSLDKVNKDIVQRLGEDNVVVTTKSSFVLTKLSDLVKFVVNILSLIIIVLLIVYFIYFVALILGTIKNKNEYIIALNACGFRRSDLYVSLITELVISFSVAFMVAAISAIFAAKALLKITSNLVSASLFFVLNFDIIFLILGLYLGVVLLDIIIVYLSIYVFFSKTNI